MEIRLKKKQGDFLVDISFEGSESGVTALYGPSGAGKSSVINMVAGLARPDSGRIVVSGRTLFDSEQGISLPPEKRRIGYVFQDGRLLPHLSVKSNLCYGMKLTPETERFVRFDEVVDLLGLGHLLDRRPARLSGGEKQRVAIGRAVLTSPSILLMDEPLSSLDPARKTEVLPFIIRLAQEFAIPTLYVSHTMNEILNLADRLVIIESGKVIASGPLEDLFSEPDLQRHLNADGNGSVISVLVDNPLDKEGLTALRFGSHLLKVPPMPVPKGIPLRVRIPARSVAISLAKPESTSFQNIIPGRIDTIIDHGDSFVDVRLDIGRPLWAHITGKACKELSLQPGMDVYALIKTVSVASGQEYQPVKENEPICGEYVHVPE